MEDNAIIVGGSSHLGFSFQLMKNGVNNSVLNDNVFSPGLLSPKIVKSKVIFSENLEPMRFLKKTRGVLHVGKSLMGKIKKYSEPFSGSYEEYFYCASLEKEIQKGNSYEFLKKLKPINFSKSFWNVFGCIDLFLKGEGPLMNNNSNIFITDIVDETRLLLLVCRDHECFIDDFSIVGEIPLLPGFIIFSK